MRPSVSSLHNRPPNFLIPAAHNLRPEDELILQEWLLVLRGDGKSPRTLEGYKDSLWVLAGLLADGSFPTLSTRPRRWAPSLL